LFATTLAVPPVTVQFVIPLSKPGFCIKFQTELAVVTVIAQVAIFEPS